MPQPMDLLEPQSAATRRIVESLGEADFGRPSPGCPGWTAKDVIVHLTGGAQMFEAIARGAISGDGWMEERQRRFAENSALGPADLKRRYAEADRALVATFSGLSPEELQAKRRHPAFGEVPVAQFLGMRISETAIHGWDIQASADPDARLQAPAAGAITAVIASAWPSWFVAEGLTRTYRFVAGGEERTLAIHGGQVAWTDGGAPDVTLTLDSGDFLLLMSGRLSSEQLVTSGRAQADGNVEAGKQLSTLFKAYGGR